MKTVLIGALALLSLGAAPVALADGFEDVCLARTAEHHPEITDAKAGCKCITDKLDAETLKAMEAAKTPAELPEAAKVAMRACGYKV